MSILKDSNRIIIKVGTSTLTHRTGMLNLRRMQSLVSVISDLKNSGKEIVLVSSGAIGIGAGCLSFNKKPSDMPTKQACAAIGQCELMYSYDKYFSDYNIHVAQVLLSRDVIEDHGRKQNVINTLNRLLEMSVIPIVNENDTVSTEEIEFGDNDTLSAIVSTIIGADLLVILSDIDGLYDKDPKSFKDARLIHTVNNITDNILESAKGKGTEFGTGGMITKLHAATICMDKNIPMIIMNGDNPKDLYRLYDGESIGTIFNSKEEL